MSWVERLLERLPVAPAQTVQEAVINETPTGKHVEITLFCDPDDGVWTAHPVGGMWANLDTEIPIVSGSDPVAVVKELLRSPAVNTAKRGK